MRSSRAMAPGVLALLLLGACDAGQPPASTGAGEARERLSAGQPAPSGQGGATAEELAERARLSLGAQYLTSAGERTLATTAASIWSDALDVPSTYVVGTELSGPAEAAAVRDSLGVIKPLKGSSFVLLSTGVAGSTTPEPGTDFEPNGTAGDGVTLRLNLQVPPGANRLTLQYNFLSSESPDFVGSVYNDMFAIELVDPSGVRAFTLASVNSSEFFAVSNSRAKGSGFDIYTPDPAGVDIGFGIGLPDAGLTDFHSFSAGVRGGSELEVRLTIQDNGDGILDSAVLIDALQFSAIEPIDPNPELVTADGKLTSNVDDLARKGRHVRGAIADGATDVLLRVLAPGEGDVTFSIVGGAPGGGTLSTVGGTEEQGSVASHTVEDGGQHFAFAVYRAPADFNRGGAEGDEGLGERGVRIDASYAGGGGGFDSEIELQIKRPPVVMAHGLWSRVLDWSKLPLTDDPRFAVTYVDHTYSCDERLRVRPQPNNLILGCPWETTQVEGESLLLCDTGGEGAIGSATREALTNVRRLGIAATQVDVVAHGAGGVRARRYVESPDYRNAGNLNRGDVNRLITLNTPHFGSPVADAIVAARENPLGPTGGDFLCRARLQAKAPVEAGDIDELTTTGPARLGHAPVPAHALVGTGGRLLNRNTSIAKLLNKVRLYLDVETIRGQQSPPKFFMFGFPTTGTFGQRDHDFFADVNSQRGGLVGGAISEFALTSSVPNSSADYSDADQFHSLRHPAVSGRLVELLNGAVGGPLFGEFPAAPARHGGSAGAARGADGSGASVSALGGVRVVSPAGGTEVLAGGTVTVEVAVEGGFAPLTVLAATDGSVARSDASPFTMQLAIPKEALGPMRLFAVGVDANEEAVVSDEVILNVKTTASLRVVEIFTQDPILSGAGARRALAVIGRYDDGVARDVTSSALGTTYQTSNAAVVTVAVDGTLTAVGAGIATVIAKNGGAQDSVTVTVKNNAAPVANAGPDLTLACVAPGATASVQLDGSASFDPDGDPLTLAWFEGGVSLASGVTPIVQLGAGLHLIELAVGDGASGPAHDTVSVSIVEDTTPPSLTIVGENPATAECGVMYVDQGAVASDACDGDLTAQVTTESNVNASVPGGYSVSYLVRDNAGGLAAAQRSVLVVDRAPPAVSPLTVKPLNPAEYQYKRFELADCALANDVCQGPLNVDQAGQIVAIHSDEPDVDEHSELDRDIVLLGPSSFKLRKQSDSCGNGRVYEVEFTVRDVQGNTSPTQSCFIGVKVDTKAPPPVNDGRVFTVQP